MPVYFWIAFILLIAIESVIVIRLIRQNEKPLVKAVLCAGISFAVYILAVMVFRLDIAPFVLILAIIAQFTHVFWGYYLRFYNRSKVFDRYQHAFATLAYALLAYLTLAAIFGTVMPKIMAALFVVALGFMLGVLVELFEFISDKRGKLGMKMQKGLEDTNFDLLFDGIGALAAGIAAYLFWL